MDSPELKQRNIWKRELIRAYQFHVTREHMRLNEAGFEYVTGVMKAVMNAANVLADSGSYASDLEHVERVVCVCLGTAWPGEDKALDPRAVKKILEGCAYGYGHWVGWVKTAIENAEFPSESAGWGGEELRLLLRGAAAMAEAFLFEIHFVGPIRKPGSEPWEQYP